MRGPPERRAYEDTSPAVGNVDATLAPQSEAPEAPDDQPVELPAPYTFRRELSRGGMGRVLIAEDRRLAREVAVKLMHGASSDLTARFEREALVTARLQHPSIVPVYDTGQLADGTPFFVMRLVSGRSLDQLVLGRSFNERLSLLPHVIAASDAMAYAHDRHIVHRDLKPQNILIGDFGETVVIDWGLAKDVREASQPMPFQINPAPVSGTLTVLGQVLGTPAYMPPEQARGREVDPRADVYALGAVLHHLLAGLPPYEAPSAAEIVRAVLDGPPPSLSTLQRGVPADLAAVTRKAMARDPAERYPNASALAEDLKKYQTGQLVGAHRYSFGERVRRFTARQRVALLVAAGLLSALIAMTVAGVARITRERDEAQVQRAEAQKQRAAAEGLVHYLVAELAGRLERLGRVDLLKGVGDALVRYEVTSARGAGAPSERQARALELLAQAEGPMGDLTTAERELAATTDLRRKLVAEAPGDAERQRLLLRAERLMAANHRDRGEARDGTLPAAAELDALARKWPSDAALGGELAMAWREAALEHSSREEREPAMQSVARAVALAKHAVELVPTDPALRFMLARCHNTRSDLLARDGHYDEATPEIDRALALLEQVIHERPGEPSWQSELGEILLQTGVHDAERGEFERMRAHYKRAAEVVDDLARRDPDNNEWQLARVRTWVEIGSSDFDRGLYPEAQKSLETARHYLDEQAARGATGDRVNTLRADILTCLGWIDVFAGRAERALPVLEETMRLRERSSLERPEDSDSARVFANATADVGYAALQARHLDEAVSYQRRSVELCEKWLAREPSSHSWLTQAVQSYGWLGGALGRKQGADSAAPVRARMMVLANSLARSEDADGEAHASVAESCYWMLRVLGRSAGPAMIDLLDSELAKLKRLRERGGLHDSAAKEMESWARLARQSRQTAAR